MSVFYENSEDVDALAEEIMERIEEKEIMHRLYTYTYVSNPNNSGNNKVQGNLILLNFL